MKYSQKYSLVGFLEHQAVNFEFAMTDWPLHVTFADVFAIDRHGVGIDEKIENALQYQQAVTVMPKQRAILGDTDVVLVERSDELTHLHTLLVNLLEENGVMFNTPAFTRDGYLPHCTIQKSGELQEVATIAELSLIDMFVNDDWQQRKVLANFKLGV